MSHPTYTHDITRYSGRSRAHMDQRYQLHNDRQFCEFDGPQNQTGHAVEYAWIRWTRFDHRTSDAVGLGIVHVQDNIVAPRLDNAHSTGHTSVYTLHVHQYILLLAVNCPMDTGSGVGCIVYIHVYI